MFTEAKLFPILDSAMKDISRRVAKIEVENKPRASKLIASRPCSIYTRTRGDYEMTFVISADRQVLKELVIAMRHGKETSEEEVPVYMKEFLNILFGHIVSKMNQSERVQAHFDVPSFVDGPYKKTGSEQLKFHGKYFYDSPYGSLELETLYNNKEKKN